MKAILTIIAAAISLSAAAQSPAGIRFDCDCETLVWSVFDPAAAASYQQTGAIEIASDGETSSGTYDLSAFFGQVPLPKIGEETVAVTFGSAAAFTLPCQRDAFCLIDETVSALELTRVVDSLSRVIAVGDSTALAETAGLDATIQTQSLRIEEAINAGIPGEQFYAQAEAYSIAGQTPVDLTILDNEEATWTYDASAKTITATQAGTFQVKFTASVVNAGRTTITASIERPKNNGTFRSIAKESTYATRNATHSQGAVTVSKTIKLAVGDVLRFIVEGSADNNSLYLFPSASVVEITRLSS